MAGAVLAAIAVAGGFLLWQKPSVEPSVSGETLVEPVAAAPAMPEGYVRRITDGMPIPPEKQPKRWFAVMVENSAEAWPLSGIAAARLVIEAPVEGSIPRLSAYFDDTQTEVKQIGPVRSVRPYYLDYAQGFEAMLAHVGGSPEALAAINRVGAVSLNEFFWGRFFWRSLARYAPHNVYTSVGLLDQGFAARGFEDTEMPSFTYMDFEPATDQRSAEQTITVPFSSLASDYNAVWTYQPASNTYARFQGTHAAADADGETVQAKNVIVLYTKISVIDDEGRRSVKTTGEGEATLFRDGQAFDIRWSKTSSAAPLRFLTDDENDVALQPGQTWIEILPLSTEVTVKP